MEDNLFLSHAHNPLRMLGNFLEGFVHAQSFPSTIKDAKTGKYEVCNAALFKRDGIPIEEYVGLTGYDVGKRLHWKDEVAENAAHLDWKLYQEKSSMTECKQVLLTHEKSILIEESTKKPIFNRSNKVIAILGYSYDITPYTDPLYLFSLYRMYHSPKLAVKYFLHHMKLESAFHELPTKKELITLLAMRKSSTAKYVAKELGVSPRTIYEYKVRLGDKLKVMRLDELLIQLRVCHEYKSWPE